MNGQWKNIGSYLLVFALLCALLVFFENRSIENSTDSYQTFVQRLEEGQIAYAEIEPNEETPTGSVNYTLEDGSVRITHVLNTESVEALLEDAGVAYDVAEVEGPGFLITFGPTLLMCGVMLFLIVVAFGRNTGGSNGKMLDFGKSRAQMTMTGDTKTSFKDVAGLDEEKGELEEIVDFLRNPGKYTKVGARIPKGVLLVGPPGTGKTLIAKAVAGEAGVPFFSISGSDFVEMFVGVGASRVRDLFASAKKNCPCIVFIDEIDAVARRRGTGMGGGAGSILGTFFGVLLLSVINNGLVLMHVSSYWQNFIFGTILVLSLFIDKYRRSRGGGNG